MQNRVLCVKVLNLIKIGTPIKVLLLNAIKKNYVPIIVGPFDPPDFFPPFPFLPPLPPPFLGGILAF